MNTSSVKIKVRYQETDRMGMVYYSNYLIWFEIGRTELFNKIGIPYTDLEDKGYRLVTTEAYCKYKTPVSYEDEIEILTQLTEFKNPIMTFNYNIRKGKALIASGETKHAFTNIKGKVTRMPQFLVEALHTKGAKDG